MKNILEKVYFEYQVWRTLFFTILPGKLNLSRRQIFFALAGAYFLFSLIFNIGLAFSLKNQAGILISPLTPLHPISGAKSDREVFGFAPFWTFDKMDKIDFTTLTTLAYFGVEVGASGDLDRTDQGYITFKSRKATNLFKKAHANGTRVVLTLTQMQNYPILAFLDDPQAQENAIAQAVGEVDSRGIDGINVDFEYGGNPGEEYRDKFTAFVSKLTRRMHEKNPDSKVTVSVYAASAKDPKIYDVGALANSSDGIFMMAYDFATASADQAMPTAPLYGHKDGTYWYDVSTAVDDFLAQMPADKLILGVPWYGYNYSVDQPEVKATTGWGNGVPQPYATAVDNVEPEQEGWDDKGKVGWRASYDWRGWRMIFLEDPKSLGIKYDFAKSKNLAGVGIWALGFEEDKEELWKVLKEKFGEKKANRSLMSKAITSEVEL